MKAFWPFLCMIVLLLPARSATAQEAGTIVSIVGKAEVFRAGQWQPAKLRQGLLPGDMVRTGLGSRVAILLADESQIKVNANSTLAIKQVGPPPGRPVPAALGLLQTILNLLSGEIWIRSRVQPVEIQTPAATATIRGTEMNLSIVPANAARLAVLEGAVEFRNPQGSVLVAAGEQATAKIGEAPRKTVLVNPLDAVQWSFYYPGIVSFRDYPLTAIGPALLPQRLAEAERRVTAAPGNLEARIELSEILFDLGRRAEARREFQRALAIDPQASRAHAGLGWINLVEGKVEEALGEFRQARPPTLPALVGITNALYRLDRFEEAEEVIAEAKRRFPSSPQPWTQAALLHLIQGRVSEALSELDQALALDPRHALASGLLSNIYLVQNKRDLARQAAEQAVAANPFSPSAYLDLSLVKQAEFRLEEALQAARKAVELDPEDSQALIQVSRLLFGQGRLSEAFKLAEQARRRAPQDPVINSTWGFLQLARFKVQEAMAAFDAAIQADSTRGEPHLGRGLALFRQSKTEAAVEEMQIATLLEPQVSLFHSYLGKAFYEVKRTGLDEREYAVAKELDPKDPTPWFYDAIAKQTTNRPVEALRDLQQAIDLNDNRAVYRSRLLLDEDLAARSAALARIYSDLGFQQLALVEGWKSVNTDPTNFSAHRFLADSYAVLPRHEIARVSELLQSQLLQPLNLTPIQPRLAESNLFLISAQGPGTLSFNEFNPLFTRDRLALQVSGFGGEQDTWAGEGVLAGLYRNASFSLGGSHFTTDGFRKNADQGDNLANAFVQLELSPQTSLQAEYRYRKTEWGDLPLRFFPDDFFPGQRNEVEKHTIRLGGRHAFSPGSIILGSFSYQDADTTVRDDQPFQLGLRFFDVKLPEKTFGAEFQHLFRSRYFHLTSGAGYFHIDGNIQSTRGLVGPSPRDVSRTVDTQIRHVNAYAYGYINLLKDVTFTVGASVDSLSGDFPGEETSQFNPKFGVTWNPLAATTVRAAVFRTLKRTLITDQTLEPTQVAGFNQFFDDFNLTETWRYGGAIDQKFSRDVFGGVEVARRDLKVPSLTREGDWNEDLGRAYLFWTPHPRLALRAEYLFERFTRDEQLSNGLTELNSHRVPLGISVFHPSGVSASVRATYFIQEGDFTGATGINFRSGRDEFWTIDAAINYRLPKRWGFITVGATNLFDTEFKFFDVDQNNPSIHPVRTFFARVTLAWP